jgi:hypothetical protein
MVFSFVAASVGIFVTVIERPAEQLQGALTSADVVAKFRSAPLKGVVVVKYRVRDVAESNPDRTYLYAEELPNRNLFAVELSREARAALKKRGVPDLVKHFTGKEVEFEGRIKLTLVWCFPACDLYTMRVDSLEQLRVIRENVAPTIKGRSSTHWAR